MNTEKDWSVKDNKWEVRISSHDCGLLDNFVKSMNLKCKASMIKISIISLPVKNRVFALLKSPFIYGKSKEHIGLKVHSRAIILDLGTRTMDVFRDLKVEDGVFIKIKKLIPKNKVKKEL